MLSNPGSGLIDALYHGIEGADTNLIARMDADDIAAPARLARQLIELHRNPDAVALGTYWRRINERGIRVAGWPPPTRPRQATAGGCSVCCSA